MPYSSCEWDIEVIIIIITITVIIIIVLIIAMYRLMIVIERYIPSY